MDFVSRYDSAMSLADGIPCTECENKRFDTWSQCFRHFSETHCVAAEDLGPWANAQYKFERKPELLEISEAELDHLTDVAGDPLVFRRKNCDGKVLQNASAFLHFMDRHSVGADGLKK